MNEYKLPGGGVDEGEKLEDAFAREVMEETGCKVKILEKLGTTEEFKSHTNFYQLSHVYLSEVIEDTHELHLTEKETAEGAVLLWVTLDEAIEKVRNCFDNLKPSPYDVDESLYSTKFVIKRDLKILEYYKATL